MSFTAFISFLRTSANRGRGRAAVRLARAAVAMAAASVSCASAPRPLPGQTIGVPREKAAPPMVGHNLLLNDTFDNPSKTLPWNASFTDPAAGRIFIDKGELCAEVTNRGTSGWAAQMRHQHLTLQKGHTYQ